jgi:hypothetical protein
MTKTLAQLYMKRFSRGGYFNKYAVGGELGSTVPITQQDWTGTNKFESPEDAALSGKKDNRGTAAGIAGIAGSIGKSMDTTHFDDWRDTSDATTGAAMGVVSQTGPVGGVIGGVYNVINPIAKGVRKRSEETESNGQLKSPGQAGAMSVAGSFLSPSKALTTRIQMKYYGLNPKRYTEYLQKQEYKKAWERNQPMLEARNLEMQAHSMQNPDFEQGDPNAQMYKHGGKLKRPQANFTDYSGTQMYGKGGSLSQNFLANQKSIGGSMTPMSKDTTLASGRTHKEGGIELPNQGAEVEDQETTSGDYVFSKELGFAQLHKPIARAKGSIEEKPATKERLNSLKLLQEKENNLKFAQEYIRSQLKEK